LGFVMGPRINAGGRVGRADLGARLLSTMDPYEAQSLAERLDQFNQERREIEKTVQLAAMAQVETRALDAPLTWAAQDGWHPGVVGIVASRLKEKTNRPSVVIGFDGQEGKGSGRSVTGIDLGAAVQQLADEGLITKGGGHKMAAGLSLAKEQLEPAMARLTELMARQGAGELRAQDLHIDALATPQVITVDLIEDIERAGPFGSGAPAPRYVFADMPITFTKRVGETHLKLRFGRDKQLEAIAFGAFDSPLGESLERHNGQTFHLAGRLEVNTWAGRQTAQLRLEDASPSTS